MQKRVKENKMIFGLHSIIEAIEAGKDIEKIYIKRDFGGELAKTLWVKIKQYGIPCQKVPQEKLNSFTDKNHQGAVAFLSEIQYSDIADILPAIYEAGRSPFVVIMDGVTDVRNFGAIARTCECAGVDAIVIPTYRSATATADAIKASSGALYNIPVCRTDDLSATVAFVRESGLTIAALTEKAKNLYTEADYNSPVALVLGAEDRGISSELLRLCDTQVKIPIVGRIESLNVSVAAGVVIYEVVRQRGSR